MRLGNEPAAISIHQVPWTSFLNIYVGLYNLAVALGQPLPLRRPP